MPALGRCARAVIFDWRSPLSFLCRLVASASCYQAATADKGRRLAVARSSVQNSSRAFLWLHLQPLGARNQLQGRPMSALDWRPSPRRSVARRCSRPCSPAVRSSSANIRMFRSQTSENEDQSNSFDGVAQRLQRAPALFEPCCLSVLLSKHTQSNCSSSSQTVELFDLAMELRCSARLRTPHAR